MQKSWIFLSLKERFIHGVCGPLFPQSRHQVSFIAVFSMAKVVKMRGGGLGFIRAVRNPVTNDGEFWGIKVGVSLLCSKLNKTQETTVWKIVSWPMTSATGIEYTLVIYEKYLKAKLHLFLSHWPCLCMNCCTCSSGPFIFVPFSQSKWNF